MDATEKTDPFFIFDHLNSAGMNPSEKTDPISFFLSLKLSYTFAVQFEKEKKEEKTAHTYDLLYSEIT
jgi:hypothetical protein